MVEKENIAVTAVKDLFHQYKHNMKEKLSKFQRTFTDLGGQNINGTSFG
jgi:hypothetical protein